MAAIGISPRASRTSHSSSRLTRFLAVRFAAVAVVVAAGCAAGRCVSRLRHALLGGRGLAGFACGHHSLFAGGTAPGTTKSLGGTDRTAGS